MVKESQGKTLIQNRNSRHITFSKRRSSIFKKACELCALCAVEMVIIIFSPGGKPYAFGNPSPNDVIDRFQNSIDSNAPFVTVAGKRYRRETMKIMIEGLYEQYEKLNSQLKEEKERGMTLKQKMMDFPDVTKMNKDQLIEFKASLENLKLKVLIRKEELSVKESVDLTLSLGKPFAFGNPSPNDVIHRFQNSIDSNASFVTVAGKRYRRETMNIMMKDLYEQYEKLNSQLKEEKERGMTLKQKMMDFPDVTKMNKDQLIEFKASLKNLKLKVLIRKEKLLVNESLDLTLSLGGIYNS
ncbi:agamous-like MADS-box protein AGL29 [Senna tora]|uniref:Agamous-like MADS-box protein AGL29 n=1 Tax=Senna tora TaxID=362788 RepID=A0A834WW14_9FABA|nr:agamous-like MADS-box protein AGL29 [Senna tora]